MLQPFGVTACMCTFKVQGLKPWVMLNSEAAKHVTVMLLTASEPLLKLQAAARRAAAVLLGQHPQHNWQQHARSTPQHHCQHHRRNFIVTCHYVYT